MFHKSLAKTFSKPTLSIDEAAKAQAATAVRKGLAELGSDTCLYFQCFQMSG